MSIAVFCPACAQDTIPIRGVCPWCDKVLDPNVAPIPVPSICRRRRQALTREQLLDELIRWYREHGEWPKASEWDRSAAVGWPIREQVTQAFGAWLVAIRQAKLALDQAEEAAA